MVNFVNNKSLDREDNDIITFLHYRIRINLKTPFRRVWQVSAHIGVREINFHFSMFADKV